MSSPLPGHAAGINECPDFPDPAPKDCETDHERFVATFSAGCRDSPAVGPHAQLRGFLRFPASSTKDSIVDM